MPGADLALLRDDQEFAVGVADMLARHRLRSEQQMARHTGECLGVARRDGLQARHECELGLRNQHRRPAHWADWYRPSSYEGPLEAAGGNRGPLNYLAIGDRLAQLVGAPMAGGPTRRRPVVDGKIFNSRGVHVAIVLGPTIFDLKGKKLFDLKGVNIYRLSGDIVGHLADVHGAEKRLDKSTDRLFPTSS